MQRAHFLAVSAGTVAASAVSPGAASAAAQAAPNAPPATGAAPWTFDRAAFEAILNRPYRHRQVFASTALDQAAVANYMEHSLAAYRDAFGEGPGTLHAVAVLYGMSLFAVVDDTMWTKYRIAPILADLPKPERIERILTKNPYAPQFLALARDHGASFFVCNNAFHGVTHLVAAKTPGADPQGVYDEMRAHFLEGAMLVPAGVAALNAAQEARFTFMQASFTA